MHSIVVIGFQKDGKLRIADLFDILRYMRAQKPETRKSRTSVFLTLIDLLASSQIRQKHDQPPFSIRPHTLVMPLESCMILLDCSQYMRNGDFVPTRLEAQVDAANLLVGAKTQSHPESTVGVAAGINLLVSPTDDVGKILSAIHGLSLDRDAEADVTAAVQVASLALKHRRNKNGAQRIVLFCGTPVKADVKTLQKAGKQLKKNNVAIDVVVMGEQVVNEDKLQELVNAANGRAEGAERTCHLVTVPEGTLPSDVLASSPVLAGEGAYGYGGGAGGGGGAAEAGGGGGFAEFGGIDPNMDPELAMALRISMEEERARRERMAAQGGGNSNAATAEPAEGGGAPDSQLSEEEALLQQALAMSMNESAPEEAAPADQPQDVNLTDDDAELQMALQMSMQAEQGEQQQIQDTAFVSQMLGSMPDVDPNDPNIQEALRNAQKDDNDKKGDAEDGNKKE